MVAVLARPRLIHLVVVVDEIGVPLTRVAAEEPVEALEAASERPAVTRAGSRLLAAGETVSLATI